jgi:hypothetical protein
MKPLLLKLLSFFTILIIGCTCADSDEFDDNAMYPVDSPENLTEFFKKYLPERLSSASEASFRFSGETECLIIDNIDEFERITDGMVEQPQIDFSKYSLIIWQARMSDSGYDYKGQSLSINPETGHIVLNVEYERTGWLNAAMIQYFYNWGVYDKLPENMSISLKINITQ